METASPDPHAVSVRPPRRTAVRRRVALPRRALTRSDPGARGHATPAEGPLPFVDPPWSRTRLPAGDVDAREAGRSAACPLACERNGDGRAARTHRDGRARTTIE